jgi:acyl-CoA synthetase (AMP-forming)/AMP-acid ligase II
MLPYQNLTEALFAGVASDPSGHACTNIDGKRYSRAEELAFAAALMRVLPSELDQVRNVALLLPPSPVGSALNIALTLRDLIPTNVNALNGLHKANHFINLTQSPVVIAAAAMVEHLESQGAAKGEDDGKLCRSVISVEDLVQEALAPANLAWAKSAIDADPVTLRQHFKGLNVTIDQTAVIMPTSGSTNYAKGAVLSHRAILANISAVKQHYGFSSESRMLCSGPLNHPLGCVGGIWAPAALGVQRWYIPVVTMVKETLTTIKQAQINLFLTIPSIMGMIVRFAKGDALSSLETLILGAEPLRDSLRAMIQKALPAGVVINNAYGLTEFGPLVAGTVPGTVLLDDGREVEGLLPSSVGLPMPGVSIEVRHRETLELLPAGEKGLVFVYGPGQADGYYNDPIRTAKAFVNGGYNTEDLGYLLESGQLIVEGRESESPKIGGEFIPLAGSMEALLTVVNNAVPKSMDATQLRITFVPDPLKTNRLVVLHTVELPLPAAEICKLLKKFPGLPDNGVPKANEFYLVPEIPINNGKVNIMKCQEIALELSGAE